MNGSPDILIIGSGMGGATMAAALAPTGKSIVILERGERLKDSPECRDDQAIFESGHFRPDESWLDGEGKTFNPGTIITLAEIRNSMVQSYLDIAPRILTR